MIRTPSPYFRLIAGRTAPFCSGVGGGSPEQQHRRANYANLPSLDP